MDAKTPKEGDIIEFPRSVYNHYGVYTGDGEVVHHNPGGVIGGSLAPSTVVGGSVQGEVRKDKLQDVAVGTVWKVNNIQDHKLEPRPTQEIVGIANSLVGKERPYNLITSNCEHLATDVRYGKPVSAQAENATTISQVGIIGAGVAIASMLFLAKPSQSHSS